MSELVSACSSAPATSRRSRPSGRSRRAAASRTWRSSSVSRRSSRPRGGAVALDVPAGDIALLRPGRAARAEDGGQVTLMTLHNAKGLEFRAVFMIGIEEGIFPHARSLEEGSVEEERRLCYVGMTRAKERLTMTHAMRRSLYGRSDANLPSRFLDELPEQGVERERLRPPRGPATARGRRRDRSARATFPTSPPATPSATRRSAPGSSPGSRPTASSPSASRTEPSGA